MTLSLIIFDCDGVLVDSEIVTAEVEAEMFTDQGLEITADEMAERFAGLTLKRILATLSEESGLTFPEDFEKKAEAENDWICRAASGRTPTMPG